MIIRTIHVEKIRGIENKDFNIHLYPNKPALFVAPNGYGKSSIATAFNSLKQNKLDVSDENKYLNAGSTTQVLSITDENGNTYIADSQQNEISDTFSVFVINSQIRATHISRRISGYHAVRSSISVEPIILVDTIPETNIFSYSYSSYRGKFSGSSKKLLYNLREIIKDPSFVCNLGDIKVDLQKLNQVRNSRKIDLFLDHVNSFSGTKQSLIDQTYDTTIIESVNSISSVAQLLENKLSLSKIESIVNAIQLKEIYNDHRDDFSKIIKWYSYVNSEAEINGLLSFFNSTWKNIRAEKKDRKLQIVFPKANQISNGERDVLCFIGKLFEATTRLKKPKGILIIDEIFDYLDDANLISAQYFLSKYIDQYRKQEKELFPIILTHLDPMFFRTYCFSTRNVEYLEKPQNLTNKYNINNLLKDRPNCSTTNEPAYRIISNNYLHYSEDPESAEAYLSTLNVASDIRKASDFRSQAFLELENYKNSLSYDVALVCCGLRLYIEKKAFEQLNPAQKSIFLCQNNKTTDKLHYARECGVTVPEVHFLLGIIYNEAMHLDEQCKKLHPITYKLKNQVIKHMICEA